MNAKPQQDIYLLDSYDDERMPADFNDYLVHIFCKKGRGTFRLSGRKFELKQDGIAVWPAQSNVSDVSFTDGFQAQFLIISSRYLNEHKIDSALAMPVYLQMLRHPVLYPDKKEKEIYRSAMALLRRRMKHGEHSFREEIVGLSVKIFFFDMLEIYSRAAREEQTPRRATALFERFLALLQVHSPLRRDVAFYSSELCVTGKYLSRVCKQASGKTASEWIGEYAMQGIVPLLKNREKTLMEISEELDFSNLSFFSQYVKRLSGISPSEYRKRQAE